MQTNVETDTLGIRNINYPEASATYWQTKLTGNTSTSVTLAGRFPRGRYMAIQLYDEQRNVIDAIGDTMIDPDAGQHNPFRSPGPLGTYRLNVVFGRAPRTPAPNTVYTGELTRVLMVYRIYYSDLANDIAGGVPLPEVRVNGVALTPCPVRPKAPPESTVWSRLDNGEYGGASPAAPLLTATNPPYWILTVTNRRTPHYPSADNSYFAAYISREFLRAPHNYDMVVVRMRAPTVPDTQAGESPSLANTTREVRFWSMCQDEPISTGVVRCIPDNRARLKDGLATFVISDPSRKPSEETLIRHGATWIAWGALQPGDFVYGPEIDPIPASTPTFYYGGLLYRQTVPNPAWQKSMVNISNLPRSQWKTAMGDYWPDSGYCRSADFELLGFGCVSR
jgi:hypothetical protein